MLSAWEITGQNSGDMYDEGNVLPISNLLKNAQYNGGNVAQWTRTPFTNAGYSVTIIWGVSNGGLTRMDCFTDYGTYSRPCFTLPSTALVDPSNALIES